MWPLDRYARTRGDSLSGERWEQRFSTWKTRPASGDSLQAASDMEALKKATESGVFDPSLLARLAKQARSGSLPGSPPGTAAPGAPGTAPASPSAPAPAQAATDSAAADSLGAGAGPGGYAFGGQDSLAAGAGTSQDSTAAATTPSPFGNLGAPGTTTVVAVDRGFSPTLQSSLNSNNDRMRLTTSLGAGLADRSGISMSANLGRDQELRLSQDSENETNSIGTSLTVPLPRQGLQFGLSAGSTVRSSLGTRTTTGRATDLTENRTAALSAGLSRSLLRGLSVNASYGRSHSGDEQTIQNTQSTGQGARSTQTTGNTWGAGMGFDRLTWLKVRGRYGRAVNDQVFSVTQDSSSSQPSSGDTLAIRVDMPLGKRFPQLNVEFQVRRTEFSYTDVSRNSGGSIQDATKFAVETETRFSRALRLNGSAEPWRFLSATYGIELSRDSVSALLRTTVFEDAQRLRWNLGTTMRYRKNGQLRLTLEGTRADVDKDDPKNTTQPLNPQTREDEGRTLSAEILQSLTSTMKVRLYGNIELQQGFYSHPGPAGLGDRDDFRSQLGARLDGQISSKAKAWVEAYVRTFDQAFIDPRRSRDSRDETEYIVRQTFDYQITPRLAVRQFYGLASKVVDQVFDEITRVGDTLNRNHFLQTSLRYEMTSRLTLDGRFDYRLQDNGFYLLKQPRSLERFFVPSARTKTDEIELGLHYDLVRGGKLAFVSRQVSTREHRTNFFAGRPIGISVTDRGNLALGLNSNIQLGDLKLDAELTRNQSFNVSLNRAVYYNVNSTLSYTF